MHLVWLEVGWEYCTLANISKRGMDHGVPSLVNVSTSTTPLIDSLSVAFITALATVSTFNGCTPTAPKNGNFPPNRELIPASPETTFFTGNKCALWESEYINPTQLEFSHITKEK